MLHKDEEEFNELVKNNHASIYRICRAYLYDVSHANDLYRLKLGLLYLQHNLSDIHD